MHESPFSKLTFTAGVLSFSTGRVINVSSESKSDIIEEEYVPRAHKMST